MSDIKLGVVEASFAAIIWENEPLTTKELVALCEQKLQWKRTTTYTVLKKLCDRGIFTTNDRVVTSLLSEDAFHAIQSEQFVQENFHGSLPAFITAFTARKAPSAEELAEIKKLMDTFEGSSV